MADLTDKQKLELLNMKVNALGQVIERTLNIIQGQLPSSQQYIGPLFEQWNNVEDEIKETITKPPE